MLSKIKLGVLVSGGGSNLQAIIDACQSGVLRNRAEVSLVISSNPNAFALERASRHEIDGLSIKIKCFPSPADHSKEMISHLQRRNVGIVCLAGYTLKLDSSFIEAYRGRIINIHPALLPKFGGKGMYGIHVHEAVIAAHESESGATVHFVDEEYDHGEIVEQRKAPVSPLDTPETLAKRVLEIEHEIYPMAIAKIIDRIASQPEAK